MKLIYSFSYSPMRWLVPISVLGFIAIWFSEQQMILPGFCGDIGSGLATEIGFGTALDLALALNSPSKIFMAWGFMLVAMMPILLNQPILHVMRSNTRRRRIFSIVIFAFGYFTIWVLAGIAILSGVIIVRLWGGDTYFTPFLFLCLACLWSASPWHQRALNRAHLTRRIYPFGLKSVFDNFKYGIIHGSWCLSSCWLWMTFPLFVISLHFEAMIIATIIMFLDRIELPGRPRWRLPGFICVIRRLILSHGIVNRSTYG